MTESYHATQCWLAFIGEPTTRIEDPTDGVVQLYTERLMVRIRVGPEPASQSAVIAMLRAGAEIQNLTMTMFSPTGYNLSAIEFAEMRGLPLFTLTPSGEVIGETVAARALIPSGEYEPPFADRAEEEEEFLPEPEPEPEPEEEFEDRFDLDPVEWTSCPRCRAHQHPNLVQCAACGADLNERPSFLANGAATGHTLEPITPASPATSEPRRGVSSLQCRSCGSHDIELIHE